METNGYHGLKPEEKSGFKELELIAWGVSFIKIANTKLDVTIYIKIKEIIKL